MERRDTVSRTTAENMWCWSGITTGAPTLDKHYKSGAAIKRLRKTFTGRGVARFTLFSLLRRASRDNATVSEQNEHLYNKETALTHRRSLLLTLPARPATTPT